MLKVWGSPITEPLLDKKFKSLVYRESKIFLVKMREKERRGVMNFHHILNTHKQEHKHKFICQSVLMQLEPQYGPCGKGIS